MIRKILNVVVKHTLDNLLTHKHVNMLRILRAKDDEYTLKLYIAGTPKPTAEWARDGNVMSDQDTDIETKEKSTHLVIPSVKREDSGEYVVTLANEVGTEKVPINVIVKGRISTVI